MQRTFLAAVALVAAAAAFVSPLWLAAFTEAEIAARVAPWLSAAGAAAGIIGAAALVRRL